MNLSQILKGISNLIVLNLFNLINHYSISPRGMILYLCEVSITMLAELTFQQCSNGLVGHCWKLVGICWTPTFQLSHHVFCTANFTPSITFLLKSFKNLPTMFKRTC